MKKCPKCHEECDDRKRLCSNCGFVFQMNDIETKEKAIVRKIDKRTKRSIIHSIEIIVYFLLGALSFTLVLPWIVLISSNPILLIILISIALIKGLCLYIIAKAKEKETTKYRIAALIILIITIIEIYFLDNSLPRIY